VSPRTANVHSTPVDNASDNNTQATELEESMQATETNNATVIQADASDVQASASAEVGDDRHLQSATSTTCRTGRPCQRPASMLAKTSSMCLRLRVPLKQSSR